MKFKKLISVFIVLMLVMTLSLALVACEKDPVDPDIPDDETIIIPDEEEGMGYDEAFDKIGGSMGAEGKNVGTLSNVVITVPKEDGESDLYTLSLGSNYEKDSENIQFSLRVFENAQVIEKENQNDLLFAIYIANGRMFMDVAGFKVALEDIPVEWTIDILEKIAENIPSIAGKINGLIGGLLPGMTIEVLIETVLMVLAPTTTYSVEDGTEKININISVATVLVLLPDLLSNVNFADILKKAGIVLPATDDGKTINEFILEIVNLIPLFSIDISATINENGKLAHLDVDMLLEDGSLVIGTSTTQLYYAEGNAPIGIPEDFLKYQVFSLTNFGFDIDLGAELDMLNVGTLMTMIMGDTSPITPEHNIVIDVKDFNLKLRVNIDLDVSDNKKNLISIELFMCDNSAATIGAPILGLYYINGLFKLNISQDGDLNALKIPNIILDGVDLSAIFTGLIDKVDGLVNGLIDKLIATAEEEGVPAYEVLNETVASYNEENTALGALASDIIPINIDEEGELSTASVVSGLLATALKIFGFDFSKDGNDLISFIKDDGGSTIGLNVHIDEQFFGALESLVPSINLPDIIKELSADLDVNWASGTLDSIDVSATLGDDVAVDLSVNNMHIGFVDEDLRTYIIDATSEKEYVSNIKDLINGTLDGLNARMTLDIELKKGKYDITGLLAGFGVDIPEIPVVLTQNYILNTELIFKLDYNATSPISSKLMIELNLLNNNFPYADQGLLFGLYIQDGVIYLDLSGIKIANISIPKINIDFDVMTLLANEINKLDINFVLDEIMDLINPPKDTEDAVNVQAASYNDETLYYNNKVVDNSSDSIFVGINKDLIQLYATSLAISNLLKGFGLDIALPSFEIKIDASGSQSINISFNLFDENGDEKVVIKGGVTKLVIGEPVPDEDFKTISDEEKKEYNSDIIQALKNIIYHVDFELELGVESADTLFDITNIINNIMAASGQRLNVPIKLDVNNLDETFTVAAKWNIYDDINIPSEILFEISSSDFSTSDVAAEREGFFVGIYYKDRTLYVDLSQLGLMKFRVHDINVPALLSEAIDGLLDGLGASFETDLSKLIADLISGSKLTKSTNAFANAAAQSNSVNALNSVVPVSGVMDSSGNQLNDIISVLLSQLSITDSQIMISLMKQVMENGAIFDPINEILASTGINLGADVGAEVMLDWFNGSINVDVNFDDMNMGVGININNLGSKIAIDWKSRENADFFINDDYADWTYTNSTNPEAEATILDTLMGMFNKSSVTDGKEEVSGKDGLKHILDIDLRMLNGLNVMYPDNQYTYASISKATRDYVGSNYKVDPQTGDYAVKVYTVDQSGNKSSIVNVVISLKRGGLWIGLEKGLFDIGIIDVAGMIPAIYVKLDLKTMLGGIDLFNTVIPGFDKIVEDAPVSYNSAVSDMNSPTPRAVAEESAGLDINTLFNDIILSINNDNSINLHADLNASSLSSMLDKMIGDLLESLSTKTENGVTTVGFPSELYIPGQYTSDIKNNTVRDLWTGVLVPLLQDVIGSSAGNFVAGMLNVTNLDNLGIYDDLYKILSRFLPVPQFEQMIVDATIVNGGMHSMKIETFHTDDYQKIEATITNGASANEVYWGGLPEKMTYDPYDGVDLIDKLNSYEAYAPDNAPFTMYNTSDIKYGGDYGKLKRMNGQYEAGVYSITATAFNDTGYGETRTIPITILSDGGGISEIEDIIVPALSELPTQVVAVLQDGTRRIVKNISVLNGDIGLAVADTSSSDPKNPTMVVKDASILINGLPRNGVTVKYLPDGVDFEGILETSADNISSFTSNLPDFLCVSVIDGGYYRSMVVDAWDTTELDELIKDFESSTTGRDTHALITGTTVSITAIINQGKYNESEIEHEVWIRSTVVDDVMLHENYKNTINIDPYEQKYAEASKLIDVEDTTTERVDSPYPTSANVSYKETIDGVTSYRQDNQQIEWAFDGNVQYDVEGGMYEGATATNVINSTNNIYSWKQDISVNVLSRVPKAIIFGREANGRLITTQTVNPYNINDKSFSHYFPSNMEVQFSGLDITTAKIEWDLSNLFDMISPEGGRVVVKATVMPTFTDANGKELLSNEVIKDFSRDILVPIVVSEIILENIVAEDLSTTIDDIASYFYEANVKIDSLLPATLRFNSKDSGILVLPVTYNTDNYTPNINGGTSIIKAKVQVGGNFVEFDYTIITPDRSDIKYNEDNTIEISYYDYLMNGSSVFDSEAEILFGKDTQLLPVSWDLNNVDFIKGEGNARMRVGIRGESVFYEDISITVKVNGAPNCEKNEIPISLSNGFESVIFDSSTFNTALERNSVGSLFAGFTSWNFNYANNNYDVKSDEITWDTSGTTADNMFAIIRIYDEKGVDPKDETKNVLAIFKVKIVLN